MDAVAVDAAKVEAVAASAVAEDVAWSTVVEESTAVTARVTASYVVEKEDVAAPRAAAEVTDAVVEALSEAVIEALANAVVVSTPVCAVVDSTLVLAATEEENEVVTNTDSVEAAAEVLSRPVSTDSGTTVVSAATGESDVLAGGSGPTLVVGALLERTSAVTAPAIARETHRVP